MLSGLEMKLSGQLSSPVGPYYANTNPGLHEAEIALNILFSNTVYC
jgi:hypothetical protein